MNFITKDDFEKIYCIAHNSILPKDKVSSHSNNKAKNVLKKFLLNINIANIEYLRSDFETQIDKCKVNGHSKHDAKKAFKVAVNTLKLIDFCKLQFKARIEEEYFIKNRDKEKLTKFFLEKFSSQQPADSITDFESLIKQLHMRDEAKNCVRDAFNKVFNIGKDSDNFYRLPNDPSLLRGRTNQSTSIAIEEQKKLSAASQSNLGKKFYDLWLRVLELDEADLDSMITGKLTEGATACMKILQLLEDKGVSCEVPENKAAFWISHQARDYLLSHRNEFSCDMTTEGILFLLKEVGNVESNVLFTKRMKNHYQYMRFVSSAYALQAKGDAHVFLGSHRPEVEDPAIPVNTFFWDCELPILRRLQHEGVVKDIHLKLVDKDQMISEVGVFDKSLDVPLVQKFSKDVSGYSDQDERFFDKSSSLGVRPPEKSNTEKRPIISNQTVLKYFRKWKEKAIESRNKLSHPKMDVPLIKNDSPAEDGDTPLISAIKRKDQKSFQEALEQSVDLEAKDKRGGYTALMRAVIEKNREMTLALLEKGADANAVSNFKHTALMLAASRGDFPMVQMFLGRNVDVNASDKNGETALIKLICSRNVVNGKIIQALKRAGADINHATNQGVTPIELALKSGDIIAVKNLIDLGADLSQLEFAGILTPILEFMNQFSRPDSFPKNDYYESKGEI